MNVVVVVVGGGRGGGRRRRQHTTTMQIVAGQRPGVSVHTVFTALVLIVVVLLGRLIIVIVFVFASVNFTFTNIMPYSRALLTATMLLWSLNPANKHFGANPTVKQFFAQYFFHGLDVVENVSTEKTDTRKKKGKWNYAVRKKNGCQWFNIRDGFKPRLPSLNRPMFLPCI